MTRVHAPYLEWARTRPTPEIDLALSNLLSCTLDDLPGAREAVDLSGETPGGYALLPAAIAAYAGVDPARVATAAGCSGANFLALHALLDPGDELLLESPGYDPIAAAARMAGASVRPFERRFEDEWAIDVARVADTISPRTRVIAISSPHNPSGVLVTEEALAGLEFLARPRGIRVLVDEVYADTVAGVPPGPAALRSDVFLSTSSLTKAYGLASLRCGWAIGSAEVAAETRRVRGLVDGSTAIPAERLSELAFRDLPRLRERALSILEPNRRIWSDFLRSRPELDCVPTPSSIAFPRFRDGRDARAFVEKLIAAERVTVVPGSFFESPSHFRVSLGGATEVLREGLARIARTLDAAS